MAEKLDFKKEFKYLYLPPAKPALVEVPSIPYIMVDGKGSPGSQAYQEAIQILYSLTFTIKMSKMNGAQPQGYFEYVVPPLEGLWWMEGKTFLEKNRDEWQWTSMIRQPDFVTQNVFEWAKQQCAQKKPELDVSHAILATLDEGLCVQIMHIGPYSKEEDSIAQLHRYIEENDLIDMTGNTRRHHEIYLSDPRRTAPERLKTVIRLPVDREP